MLNPSLALRRYEPRITSDGDQVAKVYFQVSDLCSDERSSEVSVVVRLQSPSADQGILEAKQELKRRLETLVLQLNQEIDENQS